MRRLLSLPPFLSLSAGLSRFAATSWNVCRDFVDDDEEQNDEAHSPAASCLIDHGIVDQRSPPIFVFGISIRHFVETLQSELYGRCLGPSRPFSQVLDHCQIQQCKWNADDRANLTHQIKTQNTQITQNTNAKCTAMQCKEKKEKGQNGSSINQSID